MRSSRLPIPLWCSFVQVSTDLFHAKDFLAEGDVQGALECCQEALALSAELEDKRARRAVLRVTVRSWLWRARARKLVCERRPALDAEQLSCTTTHVPAQQAEH